MHKRRHAPLQRRRPEDARVAPRACGACRPAHAAALRRRPRCGGRHLCGCLRGCRRRRCIAAAQRRKPLTAAHVDAQHISWRAAVAVAAAMPQVRQCSGERGAGVRRRLEQLAKPAAVRRIRRRVELKPTPPGVRARERSGAHARVVAAAAVAAAKHVCVDLRHQPPYLRHQHAARQRLARLQRQRRARGRWCTHLSPRRHFAARERGCERLARRRPGAPPGVAQHGPVSAQRQRRRRVVREQRVLRRARLCGSVCVAASAQRAAPAPQRAVRGVARAPEATHQHGAAGPVGAREVQSVQLRRKLHRGVLKRLVAPLPQAPQTRRRQHHTRRRRRGGRLRRRRAAHHERRFARSCLPRCDARGGGLRPPRHPWLR